MKANCLTHALDQWNENREEFRIWHNGNHVISLEVLYEKIDITALCLASTMPYLPLNDYGLAYFIPSFELNEEYIDLLTDYLEYESKEA
ncbi:MAG: hypothetical protein IMZ64_14830 [Bacteroidetes bacterium]|nr:hypothetical protein [Bacteroidota bacterium]